MIVCAADTIACRPEPHRRFTVSAGVLRHAAVDRRHPRQIHVLRLGVHDVAEHHVADRIARHVGARQHFADDLRAEIGRREVLQAPAEIADRGTDRAHHHDFLRCIAHRLTPVRSRCGRDHELHYMFG
jgi:hypothetical protein